MSDSAAQCHRQACCRILERGAKPSDFTPAHPLYNVEPLSVLDALCGLVYYRLNRDNSAVYVFDLEAIKGEGKTADGTRP